MSSILEDISLISTNIRDSVVLLQTGNYPPKNLVPCHQQSILFLVNTNILHEGLIGLEYSILHDTDGAGILVLLTTRESRL
jgi:hypothetical protein